VAQGVEPVPQPGGQRPLQLDQGAQRRLLDPGDGAGGGRAQAQPDGDGLVVVEQQRRHGRPRGQPVAARDARARLHPVAQHAQPLDVVADGAGGDVEPVGQLRARPVAPALQQGEEAEQSDRGLQHAPILAGVEEPHVPQPRLAFRA
jgi:hypothetical protein